VSTLQISRTLGRLESVATFTEFVKAFSVFGAEMVELAHITGKAASFLQSNLMFQLLTRFALLNFLYGKSSTMMSFDRN
jgi:hypothetical protein